MLIIPLMSRQEKWLNSGGKRNEEGGEEERGGGKEREVRGRMKGREEDWIED